MSLVVASDGKTYISSSVKIHYFLRVTHLNVTIRVYSVNFPSKGKYKFRRDLQ